jgi:hypothetical protein
MKTKKLTKKITNLILKKSIKKFNFFTVELSPEARYFFKKNNNYSLTENKKQFKHPLKLNNFKNIISLKSYLSTKKPLVIYVYINNIYIKQSNIKHYLEADLYVKTLFGCLKKLYVLWCIV